MIEKGAKQPYSCVGTFTVLVPPKEILIYYGDFDVAVNNQLITSIFIADQALQQGETVTLSLSVSESIALYVQLSG